MNKDKIKEVFEYELQWLNNDTQNFILDVLEKVGDEFFYISSSSTKKYHPLLCNVKHGLIMHTKLVCSYAYVLCKACYMNDAPLMNRNLNIIIAACILHDIGKKRKYKLRNEYVNHPITAYNFIEKIIDDNNCLVAPVNILLSIAGFNFPELNKQQLKRNDEIMCGVLYHMGIFTPDELEMKIEDFELLNLLIYLADFLSSQVNQNHVPYMEKEIIKLTEILA